MGEDARQDAAGPPSTLHVSVQEAAEHLGTTVDAIRKRVQRDTIPHDKDAAGRVWILLDIDRTRQDIGGDAAGHRQDALLDAKDETIADLRERVAFLEREMERRGDETTRLHQIVGGLTQANARLAARVPELEAPREAAETVEEAPEGAEPRSATGGAQEAAKSPERRGWWRRVFGG